MLHNVTTYCLLLFGAFVPATWGTDEAQAVAAQTQCLNAYSWAYGAMDAVWLTSTQQREELDQLIDVLDELELPSNHPLRIECEGYITDAEDLLSQALSDMWLADWNEWHPGLLSWEVADVFLADGCWDEAKISYQDATVHFAQAAILFESALTTHEAVAAKLAQLSLALII